MKTYLDGKIPKELHNIIYDEMVDNPFVGLNITDGNGAVMFVNKTHGRITGQSSDLYIGHSMQELHRSNLVSDSATVLVLKTNKSQVINQSVPCGKTFQVKAVPIRDNQGKIIYVVNYLIDVSELTNMQDKIASFKKQEKKLLNEYSLLKKVLKDDKNIIYQSVAMHKVVEKATRVSNYDVPVLITGPSGSGKENIANIIHNSGLRKEKPFIKINCASIPSPLLESELFGYNPGAFTGGNPKGKKGLLECANNGSILLDEIGEMSMELQSKLLRVLQDHQVMRLGGNAPIHVNFRVIASTNANLQEMITEKRFRQDLFYRLNVIEIKLPDLEERREDIPLLIDHFLRMFNIKYETNKKVSKEASRYLYGYNYKGNVRELKNVVERLIIQSKGDIIDVDDICDSIGLGYNVLIDQEEQIFIDCGGESSLKKKVAEYEKRVICEYIKRFGNPTLAAKALKIDQSTISRKMSKYNIEKK